MGLISRVSSRTYRKREKMSKSVTKTHLAYCFNTLESLVLPKIQLIRSPQLEAESSCGLFITFYNNGTQKRLRGCIGCFEGNESNMAKSLEKYTKYASLHDSRFSKMSFEDLKEDLIVSINILHSFEDAETWDDWEIGVHGTTIHMEYGGKKYNSTFLPSVAKEHKMSKLQAIKQLADKAGYPGGGEAVNDYFLSKLRVERYQSSTADMWYGEYVKSFKE